MERGGVWRESTKNPGWYFLIGILLVCQYTMMTQCRSVHSYNVVLAFHLEVGYLPRECSLCLHCCQWALGACKQAEHCILKLMSRTEITLEVTAPPSLECFFTITTHDVPADFFVFHSRMFHLTKCAFKVGKSRLHQPNYWNYLSAYF